MNSARTRAEIDDELAGLQSQPRFAARRALSGG